MPVVVQPSGAAQAQSERTGGRAGREEGGREGGRSEKRGVFLLTCREEEKSFTEMFRAGDLNVGDTVTYRKGGPKARSFERVLSRLSNGFEIDLYALNASGGEEHLCRLDQVIGALRKGVAVVPVVPTDSRPAKRGGQGGTEPSSKRSDKAKRAQSEGDDDDDVDEDEANGDDSDKLPAYKRSGDLPEVDPSLAPQGEGQKTTKKARTMPSAAAATAAAAAAAAAAAQPRVPVVPGMSSLGH